MLALLVCCGIQPLAHSSANNNLSTDYTVNVQSNTQARAQVCARETQPSAILGTSIGATCNDPLTASYYSCPTLCDVFIDTAQDLATLGDLCAAHLPCTNSALTSAEEATCCVERLLPKLAEENMPGLTWRAGSSSPSSFSCCGPRSTTRNSSRTRSGSTATP